MITRLSLLDRFSLWLDSDTCVYTDNRIDGYARELDYALQIDYYYKEL